ncbi:MAG TPA: PQQ-binding-like beta-propeller repeat protein [Candidatus Binatia bacterium]|nr:PQQ-binding-like beta-propeller repeat protein [Candidatus Binatia bacterium]
MRRVRVALVGGLALAACSSAALGASVFQYHADLERDGVYVDAVLTRAAVATLHRDPGFVATTTGATYAQPLYVADAAGGRGLILVATEENRVYALDATTGATVWSQQLASPVPLSALPCGNIDPLGITGTPVIDPTSRTIYLDAMTTPDGGHTKRHLVFALAVDDGSTRPGYPVDVAATLARRGRVFNPAVQNQRGALALVGGTVYVPYGGHAGDCGNYRGWVVGIPVAEPTAVRAWRTKARGGGVWAPGGVSSDGTSLFVATGNTFGATKWSGGESIIRLRPSLVFGRRRADHFTPPNWRDLDASDVDLGGTAPVLFDLPGARPDAIAVALGKDGKAYVVNRDRLGGIHSAPVSAVVAKNAIINGAATYATPTARYVVFKGIGAHCPNADGDLTAIRIGVGSPPSIATAWCASQNGNGSPMVTTVDGHADAIVWSVGAEDDNRLHGFDGDTGAEVFASDALGPIARFATPIAAAGRIIVAGTSTVYAFRP